MVRVISGETEVWLFDEIKAEKGKADDSGIVELVCLSRRVLKPGDTAVLTPDKGNIHALKAVSQQCSMLDFFIPPYQRSQRNWYQPLATDWFDKEKVACRKIPQHAYSEA